MLKLVEKVVPVQGTKMAPVQDGETREWFLVMFTDAGEVADRLAFDVLGRGGARLVAEWVNVALPSTQTAWEVLGALPHAMRVYALAQVDTDALDPPGDMPCVR